MASLVGHIHSESELVAALVRLPLLPAMGAAGRFHENARFGKAPGAGDDREEGRHALCTRGPAVRRETVVIAYGLGE